MSEASDSQEKDSGSTTPKKRGRPSRPSSTWTTEPDELFVFTELDRIAMHAKRSPAMVFTSLNQHLGIDLLRVAHGATRKDGATGVDGQTATEYGRGLRGHLESLLERAKSGSYRAPPVRRTHIPKGEGPETRPIGIPTFEDKILQRAVTMILQEIYEQDFKPCSHGFRRRMSAHGALSAIRESVTAMSGCWIVEVDIRKFFDSIDKKKLLAIVRKRVTDGVILRLVSKWLRAGVLEAGNLEYPERGTPQGGVVSPLPANIYLHEVLDEWFERDVQPRLQGRSFLVRYADDFVMGFETEADARRVMAVLPKRFGRFDLTLHPTKTRLIDFRRPDRRHAAPEGDGPPTAFDFLGFTHYWGNARNGKSTVRRKTMKARLARAFAKVRACCRDHRHIPVADQHVGLRRKLQGHYAYFGITNNWRSLSQLYNGVARVWRTWLCRRSRHSSFNWEAMHRLLKRYPLPVPRIVHQV